MRACRSSPGWSGVRSSNWPLMPRCPTIARSGPIGSQRNLPRRTAASIVAPVRSASKSPDAATWRVRARVVEHVDGGDARAGDGGRQSGADDLDLGELGHVSGR